MYVNYVTLAKIDVVVIFLGKTWKQMKQTNIVRSTVCWLILANLNCFKLLARLTNHLAEIVSRKVQLTVSAKYGLTV